MCKNEDGYIFYLMYATKKHRLFETHSLIDTLVDKGKKKQLLILKTIRMIPIHCCPFMVQNKSH